MRKRRANIGVSSGEANLRREALVAQGLIRSVVRIATTKEKAELGHISEERITRNAERPTRREGIVEGSFDVTGKHKTCRSARKIRNK